jgi:hypothetical protein
MVPRANPMTEIYLRMLLCTLSSFGYENSNGDFEYQQGCPVDLQFARGGPALPASIGVLDKQQRIAA